MLCWTQHLSYSQRTFKAVESITLIYLESEMIWKFNFEFFVVDCTSFDISFYHLPDTMKKNRFKAKSLSKHNPKTQIIYTKQKKYLSPLITLHSQHFLENFHYIGSFFFALTFIMQITKKKKKKTPHKIKQMKTPIGINVQ